MKGCPVTLSMCSWVLGFNPSSCDRSWNKCHLALEIFLKNVEVTYMWGFRFFFGTPVESHKSQTFHLGDTLDLPPPTQESPRHQDDMNHFLASGLVWWQPEIPGGQPHLGFVEALPTAKTIRILTTGTNQPQLLFTQDFRTKPSTVCVWVKHRPEAEETHDELAEQNYAPTVREAQERWELLAQDVRRSVQKSLWK